MIKLLVEQEEKKKKRIVIKTLLKLRRKEEEILDMTISSEIINLFILIFWTSFLDKEDKQEEKCDQILFFISSYYLH